MTPEPLRRLPWTSVLWSALLIGGALGLLQRVRTVRATLVAPAPATTDTPPSAPPAVIGEVIAGLLLGPSRLGWDASLERLRTT